MEEMLSRWYTIVRNVIINTSPEARLEYGEEKANNNKGEAANEQSSQRSSYAGGEIGNQRRSR
jgi:hypothetical protein